MTKPFLVEELLARVENLLTNAENRNIPIMPSDLSAIEEDEKAAGQTILKDGAEESVVEKQQEEAKTVQISESDQIWIKELETTALESIDDSDFDAEAFARAIGMSRRNLQRRLKNAFGKKRMLILIRE